MTRFIQTLVNGISLGSLYGLIALGYTMVYGILQFINFAHGDVFTVGAWTSLVIADLLKWSAPPDSLAAQILEPTVIILGAMAVCGTLGFVIEFLAYRPLRDAPRLNVLISAIGVSLFLENFGQLQFMFGTQPKPMPTLISTKALFAISSVNIQAGDVIIVVVAAALMAGLEWLVHHTKLGMAMRAVSQDTRTASLMGVNVDRVISLTFVIGSALAAAAGYLYANKYPGLNQPADPGWILLGLKAFVAAVVGGIGNIRGAMIGGVMIGLLEMFGKRYVSSQLGDVFVFLLLILVLLVKPTGLFGRVTVEKV